ncbi:hypothetical protein JCM10207_001911 [Rhodosporidiobolus poonsookiae]
MDHDAPPPTQLPSPIIIREKAKRSARACIQCRKLKKTCEGNSVPCVRCKASGAACIFDKPASSVVEDVGLTRLASIEAQLASNEERMDMVVQQVGDIANVLGEVLVRLRGAGSSGQTLPSPSALSYSAQPFNAFDPTASTSAQPASSKLPLLRRVSASTAAASGGFQPLPPIYPSPLGGSSSSSSKPSPQDPAAAAASAVTSATAAFSSGLDALASLASSSPDIHRFASRMGQPISALADAVAQLGDTESENKPDAKDGEEQPEGEPPAKRAKLAIPPAPSCPEQLDLVAKGLITETEARTLVLVWMKECQPFCSILDPGYDTYEGLRARSPFLFNVVVYTALRALEKNAPPSKELLAAAEETRRFARDQVFQTPKLEDVQATMVMSCYHQEPYLLSGMGLRLALAARLDKTLDEIEAHGWDKTDDKARRLTHQLRCWVYILYLDLKHSRYTGRMILVQRHDLDAVINKAERALGLPFAIFTDIRHFANLALVGIERQILHETGVMAKTDASFAQQVAYVHEKRAQLQKWHEYWDMMIREHLPSTLAWPRKSHLRMYHDSCLFLYSATFREHLLDRPHDEAAAAELSKLAQIGLEHARCNIGLVLDSSVYKAGSQWSGYLLRVDMAFTALFLLKSASAYPNLVDREEVSQAVFQLAELLSSIAGSQRYSAMLRAARDQYLSRTAAVTPPTQPAPASASTSASAPAASGPSAIPAPSEPAGSSSLRSILVPPLPTLSGPLSTFSSTSLPAFSPAAPTVPPHPSSFPPASSTPSAPLQAFTPSATGGAGAAALLPGEMEIDWSSLAVPQSLLDDPGVLLNHDWTGTLGSLPNWLDSL